MRAPDAARLALGALCLARPDVPLRWSGSRRDAGGVEGAVVRILGARYVVQALAGRWLGGRWLHRRWVPEADAAVDLVHAASMLGLARVAPRHRRLALTSATLATGFAVADLTRPESGHGSAS